MHTLYLNYGISLGVLGLIGFFLTQAKSALISGLASAGIIIWISLCIGNKTVAKVTSILMKISFSALVITGVIKFFTSQNSFLLFLSIGAVIVLALVLIFENKVNLPELFGKITNILLLGVFSWRTTMAIIALLNGHPEKLVPAILLATMALVSLATLVLSLKK
jgi:uncharacterized membrane protein (UPF0136 family)